MRTITVTERYKAVTEGRMARAEFIRQMRQEYPMYVSQFNGFEDTVQILKNKGMLFEIKETSTETPPNVPIETIERGIRVELEKVGVDVREPICKRKYKKAREKAEKNIKRDPNYYLNKMAGESNKVDKHDKMVPVTNGNKKDVFNDMKKANLKEEVLVKLAKHLASTSKNKKELAENLNKLLQGRNLGKAQASLILEQAVKMINRYSNTSIDITSEIKTEQVKEAVKKVLINILNEGTVNEAATSNLAAYGDRYSDVEGCQELINSLENIITEIETFYTKVNRKIQEVFDKTGELKDKEGLLIGGLIAPGIESSFRRDLRPVLSKFPSNIDLPKTQVISNKDIIEKDGKFFVDRSKLQKEEEKQTVFTPPPTKN